jgi:hypothetical protein
MTETITIRVLNQTFVLNKSWFTFTAQDKFNSQDKVNQFSGLIRTRYLKTIITINLILIVFNLSQP